MHTSNYIYLTPKQQETLKEMMAININDMLAVIQKKKFYMHNYLLRFYFAPYLLYESNFVHNDAELFLEFIVRRYNEESNELKFQYETYQISKENFEENYDLINRKYFVNNLLGRNVFRLVFKNKTDLND